MRDPAANGVRAVEGHTVPKRPGRDGGLRPHDTLCDGRHEALPAHPSHPGDR